MYRALTLKALEQKIDLKDESALVKLAQQTQIDLQSDDHQSLKVLLDGRDVTTEIRSWEVTNNTFYIARTAGVREIMVGWQRKIGEKRNVIVEGRDVGTVVFPKATRKFYLDADFKERVKRRARELKEQGKEFDEAALKFDLKERDQKDLTRKVGPLKKAKDAVFIDSTHLSVEESVEVLHKLIIKN